MSRKRRQQVAGEAVVLDEGLPLDQVEHWIGLGYGLSAVGHRVVAFYLRDVDHRRLYHLAGCPSTVRYASSRFGMSRSEARELLAAGHALRDLRKVDEAFAQGELCWSKVRLLVRVASVEHEERWLDLAKRLSIDELALEVKLAQKGDPPRDRSERKGLPEIRLRIDAEVAPEVYARWEQARRKLEAEMGRPLRDGEVIDALLDGGGSEGGAGQENDAGSAAALPYAVHIHLCSQCRAASVETEDGPVPIETATAEAMACGADHVDVDGHRTPRLPSSALRRRVHTRDGWRCRGCGSKRSLQPHHVRSWEDGGPTTYENLVTLCRNCHTLAHAGLLVIGGDSARGWVVEDRTGRDLDSPAEANGALKPVAEALGDAMRHLTSRGGMRQPTRRGGAAMHTS